MSPPSLYTRGQYIADAAWIRLAQEDILHGRDYARIASLITTSYIQTDNIDIGSLRSEGGRLLDAKVLRGTQGEAPTSSRVRLRRLPNDNGCSGTHQMEQTSSPDDAACPYMGSSQASSMETCSPLLVEITGRFAQRRVTLYLSWW